MEKSIITIDSSESVVIAEYRLLHTLIEHPEYLHDSRVYEDMFFHELAKSIFQAIYSLHQEQIPITKESLKQRATEIDYMVSSPVIDKIFSIEEPYHEASFTDILATLETAKKKQLLASHFENLASLARKAGDLNSDDILEGLEKADSILKTGFSVSLLKDFNTWSSEYLQELGERAKGKRYPYGDMYLDKYIFKGAYPGAITTIAAGTGQGKSTYVLNIINSLINLYIPCMYVSLEMDGMDTYDRLIALRKEIPLEDLHDSDCTASIIPLVQEEQTALKENTKFYFVEEPMLSIARLRALVKEFKHRAKSEYAIIAVDLATQLTDFMQSNARNLSVANSIEVAMNHLNALAKEEQVHIIAVVQFNRDADNVRVHTIEDLELLRPTLNNIKNSAAIAERSRVVISLFRKKFYAERYLTQVPEAQQIPDILECQILKHSSGEVGKIFKYAFEGKFFRCTPLLEDASIENTIDIDY